MWWGYFGLLGLLFGLLKRNGRVCTSIVKDCTKKQLIQIIQGRILEDSTIYTDGWTSYDGLILNGYKHYKIYHLKNEFAKGKNHINGIESFWRLCKKKDIKYETLLKLFLHFCANSLFILVV